MNGEKIKLGISACLLGQKVRYDGGHKLEKHLAEVLGQSVEFVPVCPEVEAGFPVPREPVRLVRSGGEVSPRLFTRETGEEVTPVITAWLVPRLEQLEKENLSGFIFKSKSPSCGLQLEVFDEKGNPYPGKHGVGIFAAAFKKRFPGITVVEEKDWILMRRS